MIATLPLCNGRIWNWSQPAQWAFSPQMSIAPGYLHDWQRKQNSYLLGIRISGLNGVLVLCSTVPHSGEALFSLILCIQKMPLCIPIRELSVSIATWYIKIYDWVMYQGWCNDDLISGVACRKPYIDDTSDIWDHIVSMWKGVFSF